MSVEAAVTQYRQAFIDAFEVRSSVLRVATTKESMKSGLNVTFLVSGSGGDTAVTRGVNGQIPYGNPTNTQVTATLVEKHAPYALTGFNIFASQGDQPALMRQNSMAVINREIDLTILDALSNATIDTGTSATASLALVMKARAYLGNQGIPTQEEDNMFGVVSDGFIAHLMQTDAFASADYVDVKPIVGPARKMLRWAGINWMVTPLISGVGTSTELCYIWHKSALGYAVNLEEEKITIGYDEKQDESWTRATIYHAAKVLQNTGIVQIKHDGSAFALS
jgi:hypothetical protein